MTARGAQSEQRMASEEVEKIKNVVMEVVSQLKIDTHCTDWRVSLGRKEPLVTSTNGYDARSERERRICIKPGYRMTRAGLKCTNVVNLSKSKLSRPMLFLLSKGLSFIPSVEANRSIADLNKDLGTVVT